MNTTIATVLLMLNIIVLAGLTQYHGITHDRPFFVIGGLVLFYVGMIALGQLA